MEGFLNSSSDTKRYLDPIFYNRNRFKCFLSFHSWTGLGCRDTIHALNVKEKVERRKYFQFGAALGLEESAACINLLKIDAAQDGDGSLHP